jgi:hypothetical protein
VTHPRAAACDGRRMDEIETPTPEEAESRFRELLDDGDLPQPDHVNYHAGRRELMFRWDSSEVVVVLELDEEQEGEEPEPLAA